MATALDPHTPARWWLATTALLVAVPLMVALWVAAALWAGSPAAWMALLVGLDAVVLLRLSRAPAGRIRAAVAVGFVVVVALLAAWFVVAGQIGLAFGLGPWESAWRLGPTLFHAIVDAWVAPSALLWLLGGIAIAAWGGR